MPRLKTETRQIFMHKNSMQSRVKLKLFENFQIVTQALQSSDDKIERLNC